VLSNSAPQADAREAAQLGQLSQSRAAGRERWTAALLAKSITLDEVQ